MSWTVRKEKNGKWKGHVELPRFADGRRNRKKTKQYSKKRDAENAAKEIESLYLSGIRLEYKNLLFSDLCKMFLESTSVKNKKRTTIENYNKNIKNHLKPEFRNYLVTAVNHQVVQEYINHLANAGYKYNTIDNIKSTLSSIFEYARVDLECIQKNPVNDIKIPNYSKNNNGISNQQKNNYIPPENIEKLFERFPEGNPNFLPLIFGYRCGCRDAETYAITWDDIDLKEATLDINKQLQYIDKHWCLVPPKHNSYRKIGLDEDTVELLKRERARQEKFKSEDENFMTVYEKDGIINYDGGKPVDFVIKLEHGAFKSPNTRQHIADVAHHELQIPYTYHSLRHTHATILAEEGYSPYDVMLRLGHKNINVTLKYYMHNTDGTRKASQPKLEEIMKKLQEKWLRNNS